jgi:hypothetical protein
MNPFDPNDRASVRERILAIAQGDPRATGGADIGSSATDKQDRWSDIDITFGLKSDVNLKTVLDDWTQVLEKEYGIVHYFDLKSGVAIYRVILYQNCLEMDLSVAPESEFGARGPTFRLIFGSAIERSDFPKPAIDELIGWGWHHILHANSAINRGRFWQAEFWISGLRDNLLALLCIRFDQPYLHGRRIDQLPKDVTGPFENLLIRSLDQEELHRALNATARAFIDEIRRHDAYLANKIEKAILDFLENVK